MTTDTRIELRVPDEAAGIRLDRFLADPLGSRARAQSLIDDGRVRVDGAVRPKRHLVAAGEAIEVDDAVIESGPVPDRAGPVRGGLRGRAPAGRGQARRRRRAPGPGPLGGHAGPGAGGAGRRRRGALAGRDRAPPRPRHLGPARRGQERLGAPRAEGPARRAGPAPRVSGPGRWPPARPHRDDRRPDRPPPPRPQADVDRVRRPARGPHPLRDRAPACPPRPCFA